MLRDISLNERKTTMGYEREFLKIRFIAIGVLLLSRFLLARVMVIVIKD